MKFTRTNPASYCLALTCLLSAPACDGGTAVSSAGELTGTTIVTSATSDTGLPTTSTAGTSATTTVGPTTGTSTSGEGSEGPGTTSDDGSTMGSVTGGVTTSHDLTTGEATTDEGTTTGAGAECPAFVATPDSRFEALLQAMQAEAVSPSVADPRPSGLAVAIVVDGELRHAAGVGHRAKEGHLLADEPVGADTRFWIASTSKWIHGAMVSTLVDDGLLTLDAPITDVMTDYTETGGLGGDITLHHLLTMTAGFPTDSGCYLASVSANVQPKGCAAFSNGPGTVLERLFDPANLAVSPYSVFNKASGAPGQVGFEYSNWGIMLSGRVAEVAGGAAHPDLVAARVFAPAKMCTATYDPAEVLASGDYAVGTGATATDGKCPEPELGHDSKAPWEPDELACRARDPNGGVRASVVDVGRFAATFLGDLSGAGTMLSQLAAHRMLCPGGGTFDSVCEGRVDTGDEWGSMDSYGYTNFHQKVLGYDTYTHGGGRPGYGALFWLVPEHDFAVVILGNEAGIAYDTDTWAAKAIDCWLNNNC